MLFSPADRWRNESAQASLWTEIEQGNITGRINVNYSYTFRELGAPGTATRAFQQANPQAAAYYPLSRIYDKNIKSLVAGRFTGNYVWSFHGGNQSLSSGPVPHNGDGWHVGYKDGHVSFKENNPQIYYYGSPVGAAGGWSNRHWNWLYWDNH